MHMHIGWVWCRILLPQKKKLHGKCNANKRSKVMFQDNGFIVYGVAHQHIGAIGATLYGEVCDLKYQLYFVW